MQNCKDWNQSIQQSKFVWFATAQERYNLVLWSQQGGGVQIKFSYLFLAKSFCTDSFITNECLEVKVHIS